MKAEGAGLLALIVLGLLAIGFWWSSFRMMRGMGSMSMPEMQTGWSVSIVVGTAVMWVIMMVAMMLPAAAPVVLSYTKLQSKELRGAPLAVRVWCFGVGYLLLWALVAVALAIVQLAFRHTGLFSEMGTQAMPLAAGVLLIIAGAWQLTAIKDFCLEHCRHPMTFLIGHWREGIFGAFRMGLHHGAYCVGCCIALMGLMFVFGAMSLFWMAVIAAYFLAEKLLPGAEFWGRWVGVALIAAGLITLARTALV